MSLNAVIFQNIIGKLMRSYSISTKLMRTFLITTKLLRPSNIETVPTQRYNIQDNIYWVRLCCFHLCCLDVAMLSNNSPCIMWIKKCLFILIGYTVPHLLIFLDNRY